MNKRTEGKIKSHFGMSDYYKYYKNNTDNPVSLSVYSKVISIYNNSLIDKVLNDNLEYLIPHIGVKLSIRKDKREPKIKDGKLYINKPVDWQATNKLWDEDPEAKKNKIRVRYLNTHTSGYVFRIHCSKFLSRLKNKHFFKFKPSRKFQRSLADRINDTSKDKFDAFLLHKK